MTDEHPEQIRVYLSIHGDAFQKRAATLHVKGCPTCLKRAARVLRKLSGAGVVPVPLPRKRVVGEVISTLHRRARRIERKEQRD